MSNPKLSTLSDGFTGSTISTSPWNSITVGTASLDQVNDLVILAQPTVNGTTNTFGTTNVYDATSSAIYAEVGTVANGSGHTNTIFKLLVDANNSIAIRLASGVFEVTLQTAGTTVTTTLAAYDANAHGWWRLRELSGTFYADASADGYNWSNLFSSTYSWSATAMQFVFQTSASATEVSGNVATIQHVNTMVGGSFNVNWPILEDAWGPRWTCNGGDMPLDQYVSVNARTQAQSTVTRGKQYELDECRAGESSGVWSNLDGTLDPNNTAGPYYQHIQPYQPWRRRAQWPPTRNLLTQTQATAGDDGGQPLGAINTGENGPSIFSITDTSGGSFVSTASAWQGSTVMQFAVPSATGANIRICYTPQVAVVPGGTFSLTMQVRNITASTTAGVTPFIRSLDPSLNILGTVIASTTTLTGSATAGWTTVTVTGTTAAAAAEMQIGLMTAAAPSGTCSIQIDGWQLEEAAAPSTWCCPGIWYGIFAGFTENWASSWDMGGTYGLVTPSGVDAMGLLSQVTLTDPLTQEITNNSPRFLYTLGDPAGSGSASDSTGQCQPIYASQSKYGAGSLVFGTDITAVSGAAGEYTGGTGTVMTISNPTPGTGTASPASFLSLDSAGITGPANPLAWTRMCAYRYTAGSTPTAEACMWSGFDQANGSGSTLHWSINNSGQFNLTIAGPGGGGFSFAPGAGAHVADGNWHLAIIAYSGASATLTACLDGGLSTYSIPTTDAPSGLVSDNFGAYCDSVVGKGSAFNWEGDFSYVAEFPTALSSTAMTNIYEAWLSACAGESSDQRYARILRYAGYTGNSVLQPGLTTDMGPATDIAGSDALSCLQAVCDSENGQHFVDVNGTIQFQARSARYNSLTPMYVFGENTAAGEWPYEDAQLSLDPTQISNLVQVTQNSTNQIFTAQDSTSQGDYFPRTLQRTINVNSAVECQAAAYYLDSRYRQPATRVASLVLHPSAMPALWPVALSLELGTRIQVNRRPPAAPEIVVPAFLEAINWMWDDEGEATVTLQASPVDLTQYGIFTAYHTTLHTAITSPTSTITINAGTDNTNPAAAQIGVGQQLVVGSGTTGQELVTVTGVAATSSGWSTCVITLAANTVNNHVAGVTVAEPLPAGISPASYYDTAGVFDACAYAY